MKKIATALLGLLLLAVAYAWAATTIRNVNIVNSTGSFTSLTDTALTAGNCPIIGTGGLFQTAANPCASVVTFYSKSLASPVSLTASSLTTVDSITVNAAGGSAPAFPSSGSWRVEVCYAYGISAGTGVYGETEVLDSSSNAFAKASLITNSNGGVYSACGFSPVTYPGSGSVTFTVKAENTGSQTITTTSALIGYASSMTVVVVGSN